MGQGEIMKAPGHRQRPGQRQRSIGLQKGMRKPPKLSLYNHTTDPYPVLTTPGTTNLFSISLILSFSECSINRIIQYVTS